MNISVLVMAILIINERTSVCAAKYQFQAMSKILSKFSCMIDQKDLFSGQKRDI